MKLLVTAGSARRGRTTASWRASLARDAGAKVTELDLRGFLATTFQMLVVPETASASAAHQAFDEQGALKDGKQQQAVERVLRSVLRTATALA